MNRSACVCCLLLATLAAAPATRPAATPPPKPAICKAEAAWLDRCRAALDELPTTSFKIHLVMFQSPVSVAVQLVRARGNPADIATLRARMAVPTAGEHGEFFTDDYRAYFQRMMMIPAHVALGEEAAARDLINQTLRPARQPVFSTLKDASTERMMLSALRSDAGMCLLLLGDEEAGFKDISPLAALANADMLYRPDLTARLLDQCYQQALAAGPEKETTATAKPSLGEQLESMFTASNATLAGTLARHGDATRARRVVDLMPPAERSSILASGAKALWELGRFAEGDAWLRAAAERAIAADTFGEIPGNVIFVSLKANRPAAVKVVLETLEKKADLTSPVAARALFRLAAESDDALAFARCEARALETTAARRTTIKPGDTDALRQAEETEFQIAAAYARVGKFNAMHAAIARADALIFDRRFLDSDEFVSEVAQVLAGIGHDEKADELAKRFSKSNSEYKRDAIHVASTEGHLRRGELEDAWRQVSRVVKYQTFRQRLRCRILLRWINEAKSARADEAFTTINDPFERAIIAQTMADLINEARPIGIQVAGTVRTN